MTYIRIESEDTLNFINNKIIACVNNQEYVYSAALVEKMILLTTDMGPFYDDMGLEIDVGNNTAIFIMSEHKCFKDFLFEQIGAVTSIPKLTKYPTFIYGHVSHILQNQRCNGLMTVAMTNAIVTLIAKKN